MRAQSWCLQLDVASGMGIVPTWNLSALSGLSKSRYRNRMEGLLNCKVPRYPGTCLGKLVPKLGPTCIGRLGWCWPTGRRSILSRLARISSGVGGTK